MQGVTLSVDIELYGILFLGLVAGFILQKTVLYAASIVLNNL